MSKIKRLLREGLIKEMSGSHHLFDRLYDRLDTLSDTEFPSNDRDNLNRYLEILFKLDFNPNDSFAIKLIDLNIDPVSDLYYRVGSREYYRIDDFMGRDSTGNEIWLIVRNNKATTIMLRKDIQPYSNLRVDSVVRNISDLQRLISKGLVN